MYIHAAILLFLLAGNTVALAQPGDQNTIYRYDIFTNGLVPVPRGELQAGCIYNHFNSHLNRRVWSYLQPDGKFWRAFGEGTTQEVVRLDIRGTEEQREQRLRELPDLAKERSMTGGKIFVRLTKDGRWVVAGVRILPSIYDAETGERWNRSGEEYIPVVHSYGRRWEVRNGRYYPGG